MITLKAGTVSKKKGEIIMEINNLIRNINRAKAKLRMLQNERVLYLDRAKSCTAAPETVITDNGEKVGMDRVKSSKAIYDPMAENVCHAADLEKEIEAAEHELARLIGLFRKCIEKLDPKSQEVVHCCYILGLTNRETAERLFYSITTVKKKRIQAINAANIEYMNIMGIDPNKPGIDGRRRSALM